ncbi:MAG TPA: hypothetical protein VGK81_06545 [Anaerolineae bacterium]
MSTTQNIDRWMMDALDGHLSARDRAALAAYLTEHPAERIAFERMQRVDRILSSEPSIPAPQTLKLNVMAALPRPSVRVQPAAIPSPRLRLSAPQAVFIAMVAAMLVVVIGLGTLAFISLDSPMLTLSTAVPPATAAIADAMGNVAETVLHAGVALARVIFVQPITWIVIAVCMAVAFLWARLVVLLLLPTLRFVLA